MNSGASESPRELVDRIIAELSDSALGFKVQALAAHVLLRLGYQIAEINNSGHPDIVASKDGTEYRFEVEVEVKGPRLRKLTEADFDSLTGSPGAIGYFALAIHIPEPRWVLVSADTLSRRVGSNPRSLLEAISDKSFSAAWTDEYTQIIRNQWRWIKHASYSAICDRAYVGHPL